MTDFAEIHQSRVRAHARARRHTWLVRLLKVGIPAGALGAAGFLAFTTFYAPLRSIDGLTLGPVGVSGTKVTMQSPRLSGFRAGKRPFEVTAKAAVQDVKSPKFVEMQELRAKAVTDDAGAFANLEAAAGVLNTETEEMDLRDGVVVRTSRDQEVHLRSAFVNLKKGTVRSQEPVRVTMRDGVIEAGGLEVRDNGKHLRFSGRVQATFMMVVKREPEPEAADVAAPSDQDPSSQEASAHAP